MQFEVARFYRAGVQRLEAANVLYQCQYFRDSAYLAGYSVECMLKAYYLSNSPSQKHRQIIQKEFTGHRAHDFYLLMALTHGFGGSFPVEIRRHILDCREIWSVDLRYTVGRFASSQTLKLLTSGEVCLRWVKERI